MQLEELLMDEEYSVLQAMEQLDRTGSNILFVICEEKMVGVLSDGDIRRLLLNGGNLRDSVKKAINYNPICFKQDKVLEARKLVLKKSISAIPILDDDKKLLDVIFQDKNKNVIKKKSSLKMPIVIMAGGKGTRLYPYTKVLPKPLIPVADMTIAEHIIKQFTDIGCNDFYMIVNHKKNMIKAYFNEIEKDYNLTFIDEDEPLGTGGGLSLLKGMIHEPFILTNCDILVRNDFSHIKKVHDKKHNVITMVCALKRFPIEYGVVEFGEDGTIQAMNEKPQMSFFTNTGCYIVDEKVIEELETGKSIGFPDIIERYKQNNERVGVFPINESEWLDMGNMEEMRRMEELLHKESMRELL